ncbi:MAG TPA: flagellar biosynthesis protein FlgO [Pseudoalteromonas prydzensis]|uniref:Flagellar biosynthesis protein FlgO n=1 Tax=Pseudoalteromonas prydzensis TaxID=182141 RepID=A0A7V1CYX7_9GAMM|nr:FlgO family outer membrane protein [Pseudoalteromonas prydzensis]HEA16863.1 flagellar biosynthesis protein FlgO [Pseudoalteromonas prydzensis]
MMSKLTHNAKLLTVGGVISILSACSMTNNTAEPVQSTTSRYDLTQMLKQVQMNSAEPLENSAQFSPNKHHKTLVNYVEQMALDLVDTMQTELDTSIAVTSFVDLDATLNNSNQLGNQLSESFIHQLQKFGYGIVDFKTTDHIAMNARGDFVFSRDIEQLANQRIASHVLSGTLIYRSNGVEVNARIIDITSKRVVASSNKILPYYVLNNADIHLQRASIN